MALVLASADVFAEELWTPEHIETVAWYDASDASTVLTTGSAVTNLLDKSGNGHNLTQTTATARPATGSNTVNGLNVLTADGGDLLNVTGLSISATSNIYMVVVGRRTTKVSYARIAEAGLPSSKVFNILQSVDTQDYLYANATGMPFPGNTGATTDPILFTVSLTQTELMNRKNGGSALSNTGTLGAALTIDDIGVFGRADGTAGARWIGDIGECILLADADEATIQKIEGYLAWKWGLQGSLPWDHPYVGAAPVTEVILSDDFAGVSKSGSTATIASWDTNFGVTASTSISAVNDGGGAANYFNVQAGELDVDASVWNASDGWDISFSVTLDESTKSIELHSVVLDSNAISSSGVHRTKTGGATWTLAVTGDGAYGTQSASRVADYVGAIAASCQVDLSGLGPLIAGENYTFTVKVRYSSGDLTYISLDSLSLSGMVNVKLNSLMFIVK